MHTNRHRQRGQFLISALFALAIFASLIAGWAAITIAHSEEGSSNSQGAALAMMGVGERGFIANVQGGSVTLPSNPYTINGVNWLKAPGCGGLPGNPSAGYVPCSFTGGRYGPSFVTTITKVAATGQVTASTVFQVPRPATGPDNAKAARIASEIVKATLAQQTLPINGVFLQAFANSPVNATAQVSPSLATTADSGNVELYISNAPSQDIWLRVDGTNQMLANLNMGGHSIDNAQNADLAGYLHAKGTAEVDQGLTVNNLPVQANAGVRTTDEQITGINRFASQAIYDAQVLSGPYTAAGGYKVAKPDCSQADGGAGSQPAIYAAMQDTGSPSGQADALFDAGVRVQDMGTWWLVQPNVDGTVFTLSGTQKGNSFTVTLNKQLVPVTNVQNQAILVELKCR